MLVICGNKDAQEVLVICANKVLVICGNKVAQEVAKITATAENTDCVSLKKHTSQIISQESNWKLVSAPIISYHILHVPLY